MDCGAQNTCNSDIKNHWLQIAITNTIIIKVSEILQELPKCNRDMKWANVFGEMALLRLLSAGLPQTLNVFKNIYIISARHNKAKHNWTWYASKF